jgi:hypothetical protein
MPINIFGDYVPNKPTSGLSGVGQYNVVDPSFKRSAAAEADAIKSLGMTKAEIDARGGVNASGYYGDSWNANVNLTDAEYRTALAGKTGVAQGEAINAATQAKQQKFFQESGTGYQAPNGVWYKDMQDARAAGALSATGGSPSSASGLGTSGITAGSVNAIAAIAALLSSYGLGDLSVSITEAVQKGYTSDTIQLIMQDPNSKDPLAVAFQTRFPANKTRLTAGKSVLSAAEYLAAERSYTQVLQSYGVSNLATKDRMNSFISNDISAAEVADRVGLAVDRVKNADPFTKAALAEYYPMLNQTDIVTAVLDPVEGLPALRRKVQIAEIGGAAAIQGLKTGLTSTSALSKEFGNVNTGALGAEALASFGITQEEARKGYQTIASIAPRSEFLSSISQGEDYTRLQAEQEAFLGLASAKRARESLTAQEEGRFKGQSGLTKTSLTDTGKGQY